MAIFLQHKYKQKPQAWGPVDRVQGVLFERAAKIGIDPYKIELAMPMWCGGDQYDYSKNRLVGVNNGAVYNENGLKFNGVDDYINLGTMGDFGDKLDSHETTILSVLSTTQTVSQVLCGQGNNTGNDTVLQININRDAVSGTDNLGYIYYRLRDENDAARTYQASYNTGITDGNIHLLACVIYRQSPGKIFLDGESLSLSEINSFNVVYTANFTDGFTVGALNWKGVIGTNGFFKGNFLSYIIYSDIVFVDQIAFLSDNSYYFWQLEREVFFSIPSSVIIKTISDLSVGVDSINQITNSLQISDTGTGVDGFSNLSATALVDDTSVAIDNNIISASLTVSDVSSAADSISNILNSCIVSDNSVANDIANILVSALVSDVGAGVDLVSVLTETLKTVTDISTSSDNITIAPITLSVSDQVVGNDIISSILNILQVQDSSVATEVINILQTKLVLIQDTGIANDVVNISASVVVNDIGQASDVISQVLNSLSISDSASAVENVIATDINLLPHGKVSISFSIKIPNVNFNIKKPSVSFNLK